MFVSLLFAASCTKPNPAKHCAEGTCTTPAYPFCDVTGAIGGEEGTCIAVTCAAGEFGECRGDAEVRCNANGNNYDVVQCERGCDPYASGCRLCNPNETACTNGKLVTCDATGAVASEWTCPLGCFEDQPRCRDIVPSNSLAMYMDMVPNAPDLDLSGGAVIETESGTVSTSEVTMTVPSFLVHAPQEGAAIRVIVAGSVRLGDVNVVPGGSDDGPALAILASGDITVEGLVSVTEVDRPTAGGVAFASCDGEPGEIHMVNGQELITGDGGGGMQRLAAVAVASTISRASPVV